MDFLDDAMKTVSKAAHDHGDKIKDGLDKAGRTIDEKTKGKYSKQIEQGTRAAGSAMDRLAEKGRPSEPKPEPPAPGTDPGGASEPGTPTDPKNPTG